MVKKGLTALNKRVVLIPYLFKRIAHKKRRVNTFLQKTHHFQAILCKKALLTNR